MQDSETRLVQSRAEVHEHLSVGEAVADKAAEVIGSWRFIIIQTILVCIWISLNILGLIEHWDPYPFVLLNLMFSVQAAYTGPILLLASNRSGQKDRLRDDRDDSEIGEILTIQHTQVDHDKWTRESLTRIEGKLK